MQKNNHTVILREQLLIPVDALSSDQLDYLRQRLTITPKVRFKTTETPEPIQTFRVVDGYIQVPIQFGLAFLKRIGRFVVRDDTSKGLPIAEPSKLPDPTHPEAPKGQKKVFKKALRRAQSPSLSDRTFLLRADTGVGKTVIGLYVAATLKTSFAVVVHEKGLARQWIRDAKKHLGYTDSDIGLIGDGKKDWEDKKMVVVIVHNIISGVNEKLRDAFGLVIWDEVHTVGARGFSKSLHAFNPRVRIGLSATMYRKDGCEDMFFNHFGQVAIDVKMPAIPYWCKEVQYTGWYGREVFKPSGDATECDIPIARMISILAKDKDRNRFIMDLVKTCFTRGRYILVVGSRLEQFDKLQLIAKQIGIPKESVGKIVGGMDDGEVVFVSQNCRVIFATYQKGRAALNIPRIDTIIDATPESDSVQLVGRARRFLPDKPKPVFFTIRDVGVAQFDRMFFARIKSLARAGGVDIKTIKGEQNAKKSTK